MIKYSRLYSTFSKAMIKLKSTNQRFFLSLVGPSGSGKSHIIFDWLKIVTFQPVFDNFFYEHYQPLYSQMQRIKGTMYLLIINDSCEKISNSNQLIKFTTAGDTGSEHNIHQTQLFSSKQNVKRCRVAEYTHSLVQVTDRCFTNQYIKSATMSRISIERMVSRCNTCPLWSFTY